MTDAWVGLALVSAGWAAARQMEARQSVAAIAIDWSLPAAAWALAAAVTARPVASGLAVAALALGLALLARVKRAVLGETLVFTDHALAWQVVAFPRLYLPFAPPWAVGLGALVPIGVAAALLAEAPSLAGVERAVLGGAGLSAALLAASAASRLPFAGAAQDSARFGLFATLVGHGLRACRERASRRAALPAPPAIRPPPEPPHLVLVQAESFCDPARVVPGLAASALPAFDRLRRHGAGGTFRVRGFGANTMRTEFSVLTGLGEAEVGLDAFNPYAAFARSTVPSLAWRLAAAGWRTVCVHPFAGSFFRRDRVMPALGFASFLDARAFPRPTHGRFVPDLALADFACRLIAEADRPLFLFLITIENHGPYPERDGALGWSAPADLPEGRRLAGWLAGLARTDAMLERLVAALEAGSRPWVLCLYGDHPPALPRAFSALGAPFDRTDWTIAPAAAAPAAFELDPVGLHRRLAQAVGR
ncbi:MAG: LTA synthase family protein [Elioraea sp.]|nr:LTA synthase family protein [Elioraea sp.]